MLYHNQKMFQTLGDGGYAAPLIFKGIIQRSNVSGQIIDATLTFEVPDYIWTELEKNRDAFQYEPPPESEREKFPWAIPWMRL